MGAKGDPSFILKLLLALYSPEELRLRSITGKPSRNTKYGRVKSKKLESEKLQFIKGMCFELFYCAVLQKFYLSERFYERVRNEALPAYEMEKRCRVERIHKIVNIKIQNLKRKRPKGDSILD